MSKSKTMNEPKTEINKPVRDYEEQSHRPQPFPQLPPQPTGEQPTGEQPTGEQPEVNPSPGEPNNTPQSPPKATEEK